MSYEIVDNCVSCWACEGVCPSKAISPGKVYGKPHFVIDPKKCTECEGDFADAQCASICPIEGAILDPLKEWANKPGSLTGIPPERLEAAMAEIQAR
jgi:ferredoxin